MPKYLVELQDGRKFEVEASAPPTEADIQSFMGKSSAPSPPPFQPFGQQLLSGATSTVGKVFDVLSRPGAATAGAVSAFQQGKSPVDAALANLKGERKDSFENVLENAGVGEGLGRSVAGFALDVVVDPLNLVGAGLGKAAVKGASKAGALAKKIPGVSPVVDELGKALVPLYGLPETVKQPIRLKNAALANAREQAFENSKKRFLGEGFWSSPLNDGELDLISRAIELDAPNIPEKLKPFVEAQRDEFERLGKKAVAGETLPKELLPEIEARKYVPHRLKGGDEVPKIEAPSTSATGQYTKKRYYPTFQEGEAAGKQYETNIAKLAAGYEYEVEKSLINKGFLADLISKPEFSDIAVPKGKAPAGYRGLTKVPTNMPFKLKLDKFAFEPAVAEHLDKMLELEKNPSKILQAVDRVTNAWKSYATVVRPAFHTRNLVSNVFNSYLGGMDLVKTPIRYAEAARAVLEGKVPAKIGQYTGTEVLEAAKRTGVVGTEFGVVGDLGGSLERELGFKSKSAGKKAAILATHPEQNLAVRAAKGTGQIVEDTSRMALFIDQLHKGKSIDEASSHVNKYLFNYGENTDFERHVAKRLIPFWGWMRRNIPLQVESLITQPEKYANVAKASNAIERATEQEGIQVPNGRRPEYIAENTMLQLPLKTAEGEVLFANTGLPYLDLNKIPSEFSTDAGLKVLRDLVASSHPLAKAGFELAGNRDMFRDRPLYNETGGIGELVKAPEGVAAVADLFPELAYKLGIQKGPKGWMMRADAKYATNLIPTVNAVGKAARAGVDDAGGTLPGGLPVPLSNLLAPISLTAQSQSDLAEDRAFRLKEAAQKKRRAARQKATTIPLDQLLNQK